MIIVPQSFLTTKKHANSKQRRMKPPQIQIIFMVNLWWMKSNFLVACRFVRRLVGRSSVGRSVGRSHFTFYMFLFFLPHWSCPNGLVTSNTAPAPPHATSVAVYPALFIVGPVQCMRQNVNICCWVRSGAGFFE